MYNRNMTTITHFRSLGIDVWLRRGPRQGAVQDAVDPVEKPHLEPSGEPSDRTPSAVAPVQTPAARDSRSDAEAAPAHVSLSDEAFRVHCFRYGRVFAALSEDARPLRRLLLDVAWALNGFQIAQREDVVFDWPQPGAVPDGGGRAFRAFFRHQTLAREGVRVLISGARVSTLLDETVPDRSCVRNGMVYVVPRPPDAVAKKALWKLISDLVRDAGRR